MAISFPTSPTIGEVYEYDNRKWTWDGIAWVSSVVVNTAAGLTGEFQFNNSGLFGGAAGLVYSLTGTNVLNTAQNATDIPLAIKGAISQTANLLEIRNSSSTVLAFIDSDGNFTLNSQKDIRFADSDSSNWVALQAPAIISSNVTWTLPNADGSTGQVLQTDGSGILSWVTVSGISASGNNGEVQFNDSGKFGGATGIIYATSGINFTINSQNNTDKALVVKAASSQSANLLEIQNNSGTALVSVNSNGSISLLPYGTSAGNTNELRFLELAANGSNYIGFKSSDSIASNIIWTLPNADGASGQSLVTDGSGILSWTTITSGGTPAGSTGDIQFNNGGVFGGATGLSYSTSGTNLLITSQNLNDKPLVVKGTASQSANLLELQNNSSSTLFAVNSSGEVSTGTWKGTAIGVAYGGTNITSYTTGDIVYASNATTLTKLGIGTTNFVLTSSGSAPQWVAQSTLTSGVASKVPITDDTATNNSNYLTWVTGSTGNQELYVTSTKLTFNPSSGNLTATQLTGTLQTAAQTNITSVGTLTGLTVSGAVTVTGDITLNGQSDLRFADANSSNWVAFQAPVNITSNVTWTLPSADGSTGQVLSTNGLGVLSWETVTGGTGSASPGGSSGQIQYNDAGTFGGAAALEYSPSGTNLSIYPQNTTDLPLMIQAYPSQSADLLQIQDSSTNVLVKIDNTGSLTLNYNAELKLGDSSGTNYLGIKSPSTVTSSITWTLPDGDGTNGQVLGTNGSGSLTWTSLTVTNPAGTAGELQFNDSGIFGGTTGISYATSGTNLTINAQNSTDVPLAVYGAVSQSSNLLEIKDSTSADLFVVDNLGNTSLKYQANLTLYDSTNSGYVGFKSPTTVLASTIWSLPDSDGSSGYAVVTDGSGNLSWANIPTGSAPSGSNGDLQYNNSGSFDGTTGISYATSGINLTVTSQNSTDVPFLIKGASLQSGDLQQWQKDDSSLLARIDYDGNFTIYNQKEIILTDSGNSNYVSIKAPATVTGTISFALPSSDGISGQSLITDGAGNLSFSTINGVPSGSSGQVQYNNNGVFDGATGFNYSPSGYNISVEAQSNTDVALLVKAANSQSANLQEWQDSSSTNLMFLDANGNLQLNSENEIRFADSSSTNYVGFKGANTISSSLTWTLPAADGTSGQFLYTDGYGSLNWANGVGGASGYIQFNSNGSLDGTPALVYSSSGSNITVYSQSTTDVPLVVTAISGQTANLQEWQDDALNILSYVDSSGNIVLNLQKETRYVDSGGTNYVGFKAPTTVSTDTIWTLPDADGVSGQGLFTDGTGKLSWINFVSSSAGASGDFQFNSNGLFAGATGVSYEGVGNSLLKITSQSATTIPLTIIGAASQTADLLQVLDSTSTPVFTVFGDGSAGISNNSEFKFYDSDNSNYVSLKSAAAVSSDITWTLPDVDGTTGQALITDGAGTLSWSNIVSQAAGTNSQFQYNNAGVIDGTVALEYGATGTHLSIITQNASTIPIHITGASGQASNYFEIFDDGNNAVFYISSDGNLNLANNPSIKFFDSSYNKFVGFKAPASVTTNTVWELPDQDGATGNVLYTDGNGSLSWTTGVSYSSTGSNLSITSQNSSDVALEINAASGQSSNIVEVKDNSSNLLLAVGATGNILEVGDLSGSPIFTVHSDGYTKNLSGYFTGQTSNFTVFSIPDNVGVSAFFDYYIINTTNSYFRAGMIVAVWNSTLGTVEFNDTSTNDLGGSTSDFTFNASISSGNFILTSNILADTWTVKISARIL